MIVPAERVSAEYVEYLTETGLLAEGETLLYFYSNGFFSIEGDGVFASDWGVTSYWIDPVSEELAVAFIRYEENGAANGTSRGVPAEERGAHRHTRRGANRRTRRPPARHAGCQPKYGGPTVTSRGPASRGTEWTTNDSDQVIALIRGLVLPTRSHAMRRAGSET